MTALRLTTAAALVAGAGWLLWWAQSLRHPGPVAVAVTLALGACLTVLVWILQDHADQLRTASWSGSDESDATPADRLDYRMLRLRRDLRDTVERSDRVDAVQPLLRKLAAERLRARHGVGLDDARAAELLGPGVHAYLTREPLTTARRSPDRLRSALDRIEAL